MPCITFLRSTLFRIYLIMFELKMYQSPAHRVEFNMDQCCHRFNIQGNFAVLPTLIIITFGNPETRASETHVLRVAPGLNVAKLDEVDELCDQVACGAVTLAGI